MNKEEYPSTRQIVYLLGMGALLTGSVLFPGLGLAAGYVYRQKRQYEWQKAKKEWKKFNIRLLRRNIKRLQEGKIVEVIKKDGHEVIKLTEKGKVKYLKFKLEELALKNNRWDGKWRVVIYDISKLKNSARDSLRSVLKKVKFLQLQKSVYLTPYKCNDEIKYLKEYFGVGDEVVMLEVNKLENEKYYREYFGV